MNRCGEKKCIGDHKAHSYIVAQTGWIYCRWCGMTHPPLVKDD